MDEMLMAQFDAADAYLAKFQALDPASQVRAALELLETGETVMAEAMLKLTVLQLTASREGQEQDLDDGLFLFAADLTRAHFGRKAGRA